MANENKMTYQTLEKVIVDVSNMANSE